MRLCQFTRPHSDRYLEGYGLSLKAIDEFRKQNAKLIITLDCGVATVKEVEKANSLGFGSDNK